MGPTHSKSCFPDRDGSMPGCQVGEEQLGPAELIHPDAHRPSVMEAGPERNRCVTLSDVQDHPQPCPL